MDVHLRPPLEIFKLRTLEAKMNLKDIKIECIVRGMDFDKVIKGDFPNLAQWLIVNVGKKTDTGLLNDYDDYIDKKLEEAGKRELIHPSLRLGYLSSSAPEKEKELKKKTLENKPKKKLGKDKRGIKKNTKKSLTFKLQCKGYRVDKVIKRVKRRFPDANEKSIKIWYRKSERLSKGPKADK